MAGGERNRQVGGHREGQRKQRAEETEEPRGRNTSPEGGEENAGGCLHCPGALWMSPHVPLPCPFCVTGVVPCTIQHCSCAWVTGDMQVRTSAEGWPRPGRCHKSPQAVWEMGGGQGMSELGLSAVCKQQSDMADRACTSRDGGLELRVGRV